MPRKITTGTVGGPVLGDILTQNNSFKSVEVNTDINFEPDGTGIVVMNSDLALNSASSLVLRDSDSSAYVGIKSPGAVSASYTLTLPTADGTDGQALTTDGSGTLSFSSVGLTISNKTNADNTTYYPSFADSTTGTETGMNIHSARLTYVPNPGTLTVYNVTCSNDMSVGNDLTVTADFSAATITESSSIAYKENVNPITNALDTILQLQGVTYDRKGTDHKSEAGLIAEEVAPILPNIVSFKDGKPEGINYTKLTAYLIEAVKSLKDELDKVKK